MVPYPVIVAFPKESALGKPTVAVQMAFDLKYAFVELQTAGTDRYEWAL
jgi:hypothetical protein